jgi:hypothetical protein
MKDWMVRALKTFVQAFFGVLIPEFVVMLRDGSVMGWNKFWTLMVPVLCAALAAGISAAWNIIAEVLKKQEEEDAESES